MGFSRKVKLVGEDNLKSWALHKYKEDIDTHVFTDTSVFNGGDTIVYRGQGLDKGINKILNGPDRGRILSDWELDDYINSI